MLSIAKEYEALQREQRHLMDQVAEIEGYEVRTDPETGDKMTVPIPVVSPQQERWMMNRIDEVTYHQSLLMDSEGNHGPEAQRRLQKALAESVELRKRVLEQAADNAEIKRRAAEMTREKRINAQAEKLASFQSNEIAD